MPKDLTEPQTASLSKSSSGSALRRNQACHQCRRRKLKCDAKRPCSTCVRSHSYALAHSRENSCLSPNPECTYDDVPDISTSDTWQETSGGRYERLENRILELEALLKEKQDMIVAFAGTSVNSPQSFVPSSSETQHAMSITTLAPAVRSIGISGEAGYFEQSVLNRNSLNSGALGEVIPMELDVLWPKWPQQLPRPDLLRHIVDAFFAFHPHATRLLHKPTFLTCLSLPPDHPNFPSSLVLHAVCAVGSVYTIANRQQFGMNTIDFAEEQVTYAKNQIDQHLLSGQKALQCLQATVILSWYYWSHARWMELFISTGQSLRIAVPLGLNLCPPFHALNASAKSSSIISMPLTFVEDETRRNAFWLAYAIDRQYSAGNGWAMSLDDNDIAQLLPLPRAKLDEGIPISAERRQWSHLRESYLVHPPEFTDSFTLYIKVMLIVSRIKNFNNRFRVMEHLGDPDSQSTRMNRKNEPDIRSTTTFSQLDDLIASFRSSLSHEFRDPFVNDCIDPHLYTAHMALFASTILLHEPHSNTKSSICTSAMKILHAARGILELVYVVLSTNYDLGLLDLFCPFCWFLAGRVFTRFLKAARDANSIQHVNTLQVELEFIRTALGKMGEKVQLSARYQKMLDSCLLELCGPSEPNTITVPVNGIPVRTTTDDFLLSRIAQNMTYDVDTFLRLYNGLMEDV